MDSIKAIEPLAKAGDILRKARKEKNLSIEVLASSLRIGEEQLIALEDGKWELLPEEVFVKAMIRRVAERLQINAEPLIEGLKAKKDQNSGLDKKASKDKLVRQKLALKIIIPKGITNIHDAWQDELTIRVIQKLENKGEFPIRCYGMIGSHYNNLLDSFQ